MSTARLVSVWEVFFIYIQVVGNVTKKIEIDEKIIIFFNFSYN